VGGKQVDPLKAKEGDDTEANMRRLLDNCQRIMDAVYSTAPMIPTYATLCLIILIIRTIIFVARLVKRSWA
jgi:hypothetical protein